MILPGDTTVEPDLLFVSAARRHIITSRACEGPPDLVVEILSPSNPSHDLERKRELYARHGIPEYLILDPNAEIARLMSAPSSYEGQGMYASTDLRPTGSFLTFDALPGLVIGVADIFADPW